MQVNPGFFESRYLINKKESNLMTHALPFLTAFCIVLTLPLVFIWDNVNWEVLLGVDFILFIFMVIYLFNHLGDEEDIPLDKFMKWLKGK